MAVLNKIRQRSIFLIIIIALALFSFVLADLFQNGNMFTAGSQNTVGVINGIEIKRDEFLQKVEIAQRQAGASATNNQVINSIWDQEVRKAIMETQYEKLGMTVEKDQMLDILKLAFGGYPQFMNEAGQFDESKLNEFIANLKEISPNPGYVGDIPVTYTDWVNNEKSLAASALQQNYFNMVKAGLSGTLAEGELEHKLEGSKRDIKYVQIPYSFIEDSKAPVSKSEISDYIKKHEKQYQVEASRNIRYVDFKEKASEEDKSVALNELKSLLNDKVEYNQNLKTTDTVKGFLKTTDNEGYINSNSDIKFDNRFVFKSSFSNVAADSIFNLREGQIYGPYEEGGYFKMSKLIAVKQVSDSAKVRHILIPFTGATGSDPSLTKTDAQAKATADSIYNVVKSNRSKFVELLDLSSDKVSNEEKGEIKFAYTDSFAQEFKDFSFNNKTGDLQVVKTSFGYHIIEILSQTEAKKAVQVGTIVRKIEPSETTIDKIFRDASNFEIAVVDKDFSAVAAKSKYAVLPVNGLKAFDENIPGIGNERPIVRWAFADDSKVGDVKKFSIPGGYAIVQLVAEHEKGLMSPEDASASVTPIIRKQKKAEIIKNRVKATNLEALATAEKTSVKTALAINMKDPIITGAGREPLVVGSAFGLKQGKTSKLIEGDFGVYMVQVTKVEPAVKLDNYQAAANRVEQQKLNVVSTKLYDALKNSSEIEDNRAKTQVQ
jgi:peptidyl-prolyl cis-trans isomerase D